MSLYPVFLSLAGCRVLVAGAGAVGRRKIAALRDARPADLCVFDPALCEEDARELASYPGTRVFFRSVEEEDIAGCALVFAATGDAAENGRIAALCAARQIFCNIADNPDGSSFHVPACARVGDLAAAFSTGGHSPALAARIRKDATVWLEDAYGPLLTFMGRLRPLVLVRDGHFAGHGELFRTLVNSGLGEALSRKDGPAARHVAHSLLPEHLHGHIEELLHGLC